MVQGSDSGQYAGEPRGGKHKLHYDRALLTRGRAQQIIANFMVQSVEDLERIANPEAPVLDVRTLTKIAQEYMNEHDREALDTQLAPMEKSFRGRGNPSAWSDELLTAVDQCFIKHFYVNNAPCDSLFYPGHPDYLTRFMHYCSSVDQVLIEDKARPPYSREYFAYAMLWKKRGQRFPVPLGTASVVEALHLLTKRYKLGLAEVRDCPRPVYYFITAYKQCAIRGAQVCMTVHMYTHVCRV